MGNKITGQTQLAGLIAHPARHSISPKMHNLAFTHNQIDACYLAFDVLPENLQNSIEGIRSLNLIGVNLSMPHKQAVIPLLDELSQEAQLIGAVNTIVNQAGRLIGYNTDGVGFIQSLKEEEIDIVDKKMVLLGTGGAATAIMCQAALDGIASIALVSRHGENYEKAQQKIAVLHEQTNCQIQLIASDDEEKISEACQQADLLVNATNVGMGETSQALPFIKVHDLRADLIVIDIIYYPKETYLLKSAREIGAKTINGLGMLVHQGAKSFELWTGKKMPTDLIKKILEKNPENEKKEGI